MITYNQQSIHLRDLPKIRRFDIVLSMDIDRLIGSNLRRIREIKGISQDKLAELIETPATRLSAYENGREGMGKDIMTRICKALNVQPYEFYLDENTPLPATPLEKKALFMARAAESSKLDYIAEEIIEYGSQRIERLKKEQKKAGADKGNTARLKAG